MSIQIVRRVITFLSVGSNCTKYERKKDFNNYKIVVNILHKKCHQRWFSSLTRAIGMHFETDNLNEDTKVG